MARVCSRGVTMFGLIRGRAERGVAYMVRQALPWCGLHAVVRFKLPRSHLGVCPPKTRMAARMVEFSCWFMTPRLMSTMPHMSAADNSAGAAESN